MPETVMAALAATARAHPGRIAFARKEAGAWRETTFAAYHSLVRRTARGLMALGAGDGRNVVILSANRPEWLLASLGAAAAGSVAAGLYTTSAPQQCEYIAHHCEAVVAVVENEAHLRTFLAFRDRLPHLQAIVLIEGRSTANGVSSWDDMLRRGDEVAESELDERIAALDSSRCASLIYTSGTTGPPKAVMISHESLLWVSRTIARVVGIGPEDRGLCYLPLSHVAEQTLSLFGPVANGLRDLLCGKPREGARDPARGAPFLLLRGASRVGEDAGRDRGADRGIASPLRRRLLPGRASRACGPATPTSGARSAPFPSAGAGPRLLRAPPQDGPRPRAPLRGLRGADCQGHPRLLPRASASRCSRSTA